MGFLDARFGAYLAVAALLIATPGPDTALVMRNALLAGKHAASFTILGVGAGSFIWALASCSASLPYLRGQWSLSPYVSSSGRHTWGISACEA